MDKLNAAKILRASNELLKKQMEKLEHASESMEIPQSGPYDTLQKCQAEYEAVETAISVLEAPPRSFFVKTPCGKLKVTAKADWGPTACNEPEHKDDPESYPGVFVDLIRDGQDDELLACVEYDSTQEKLQAAIYTDVNGDAPSDLILFESVEKVDDATTPDSNEEEENTHHFGYAEARTDIVNYLELQPDAYFTERGRLKLCVLNDTEQIAELTAEHLHRVKSLGNEPTESYKNVCDSMLRVQKKPVVDKEPFWAEVRNGYTEHPGDEKGIVAITSIDAWKTADNDENGDVIAKVIRTEHGDVCVVYIDSCARYDAMAQEKIEEAVNALQAECEDDAKGEGENE